METDSLNWDCSVTYFLICIRVYYIKQGGFSNNEKGVHVRKLIDTVVDMFDSPYILSYLQSMRQYGTQLGNEIPSLFVLM